MPRRTRTNNEPLSRKPLTPNQQALAVKYLPLARSMAQPMKQAWPSCRDEFESAALLALVESAQSFDTSKDTRFSTFARLRIQGALRDVLRRRMARGWRTKDHENAPSIEQFRHDSEVKGQVVGAQPPPPVGQRLEAVDAVEVLLRKLPPKHAQACRDIYLDEKNQVETAQRLGCSQSRLSYMHREALAMLGGTCFQRRNARTAD